MIASFRWQILLWVCYALGCAAFPFLVVQAVATVRVYRAMILDPDDLAQARALRRYVLSGLLLASLLAAVGALVVAYSTYW
jgi:hypothetical protein